MIPLPCRQKGGAPQLGAKGPQQRGPFGVRADEDHLDEDGDQDDEDDEPGSPIGEPTTETPAANPRGRPTEGAAP
ncbi:hypothetical protein ACFZC6_16545 [Streptomyces ossamyceticus]|uniref:hypothetical protein n=1 Tax=Streptomyces ossamyceticus TaxID=249581 RepID=UPI0036E7AFC1